MSVESDIEIHTALPKKKNKPPKSSTKDMLSNQNQETKKPSTKEMIHEALTDMKSRKGSSLYAIKKYIGEKFHVDVEKMNYLIKKSLKDGVEGGTIVQTKGMGASGSFKLPIKAKSEKKTTVKKSETKLKLKPTKKKIESEKKKNDNKIDKPKNKTEKKINGKKQAEKGKKEKPK